MSLPSPVQRRWGLRYSGRVAYLDLGDAVVFAPRGLEAMRRLLLESVSEQDWEAARSGFGDPDLANE